MAQFFQSDFSGGLNLTPAVDLLEPNESLRAENVRFDEVGAVGSGGERTRINTTAYNSGADIHTIAINNVRNLVGAGTKVYGGALSGASELVVGASGHVTKSPTAASGTNWTNPTFVFASDDNRASYNATTQDTLKITGFSFALPASSTIVGFEVLTEGHGTSATAGDRQLRIALTKDGTSEAGTAKTAQQLAQTTDTTITSGSSTDLWGTTWTQTQVEASTFGVIISDNDTTAAVLNIDHVRIRVYFTYATAVSNASSEILSWAQYLDKIIFESSGTPYFVKSTGSAFGIDNPEPTSACSGASGATGNLTGTYTYKVTFGTADDLETPGGPASAAVGPVTSKAIDLTSIPLSTDGKHTKRFIYRTGGLLPVYYQVAEIPDNTTTTYTDNVSDTQALTDAILLIGDNDRLGAEANVKYPEVFFDRLFWVDASRGNRLVWSKPLNWLAYPDTNYIDFPSTTLYRLVRFLNNLIIFADDSIYILSGNSEENFVLQKSLSPVGTRWPYTVSRLKDRLVFLNDGGMFFFDGLTSRPMTNRLDPFFLGQTKAGNTAFDLDEGPTFVSAVLGDTYWLGYAEDGQSENNRILQVDLDDGRISKYNYGALSVAADVLANDIYMGDTSGVIYRLLDGSDNAGGSSTFTVQTKFFDPVGGVNKHFQAVVLDADTDGLSITPSVQFDSGNSTETLSAITLSNRQSKILRLSSAAARKARNLSLVFSGTVTRTKKSGLQDAAVRLFRLGILYEPLHQRESMGG